jgi:type IV pilus assembly protein PilW
MKTVSKRSRVKGISLIEVLISLVIGLVVVGAVLVSIIGAGKTGRFQAAYSQMNEDAQIAMSILSRDVQMAGYSAPTGLSNTAPALSTPTFKLTFGNIGTSTFVIGCDTGFSDPRATVLACGTATTAAMEVVYQADKDTTVLTTGGSPVPSDCLGNGLAGPPYIARNRYFISTAANSGRPELSCASPGVVNQPQPLVENIETMRVLYGVAVAAAPTQVVRYVSATQIAAAGASEWLNVLSVRICLQVRSAELVLDNGSEDTLTYLDCDGTTQTSNDRYLRRVYFSTSALRDKMP